MSRIYTPSSGPDAWRAFLAKPELHWKTGYGNVTLTEGNKLTVEFDKAGEKKVIDPFVERG